MREVPIILPPAVSGDDELAFGQWLVDDGEIVLAGDRVAEVLTSGILLYVASPAEGAVQQGNVQPGAVVTVGTTLGAILADDEESTDD